VPVVTCIGGSPGRCNPAEHVLCIGTSELGGAGEVVLHLGRRALCAGAFTAFVISEAARHPRSRELQPVCYLR
jgi:hypothetical protein